MPAIRDGGGLRHGVAGFHEGAGGAAGGRDGGEPSAFIGEAWRWKQRIGGAMRQGGICAAACLYALDHNVERLAEDHANARSDLARGAGAGAGAMRVEVPQTNLVFIDTAGTGVPAAELARRARMEGLLISVMGKYRLRACTHLDVDAWMIAESVAILRGVVAEAAVHAS